MSSPRDRITSITCRMLAKRGVTTIPASDENLRETGLTSLDMVNLMLSVEAEFDFTIPQAEITPENFQSVATLERMIVRQMQTEAAA